MNEHEFVNILSDKNVDDEKLLRNLIPIPEDNE